MNSLLITSHPEPTMELVQLTGTLHELTTALTAKESPQRFIISDGVARDALQHSVGRVAGRITQLLTPFEP